MNQSLGTISLAEAQVPAVDPVPGSAPDLVNGQKGNPPSPRKLFLQIRGWRQKVAEVSTSGSTPDFPCHGDLSCLELPQPAPT